MLDASSHLFSSKIVISNNFFGWQMSFICWFVIWYISIDQHWAINPFILNSFSSNYCATVNLNTYSLNVSLFLSVASTKFILQNKSQTSKLNSIGIKNKGNKSKPGGWLRYILVISIGTSVPAVLDWSSRLKFYVTSTHQQGWAWWEWLQFICQASKETPFFKFKSYFTNIF